MRGRSQVPTVWKRVCYLFSKILHLEGLYVGPVSLNLIEPHLYLGGLAAARDLHVLNQRSITHILTIDTSPLSAFIIKKKNIKYKFVRLYDFPDENLLSHFDDTFNFISRGVAEGNILVHCFFGASRSASVVIAYLMKKYNLSYQEAFMIVKKRRKIIMPNYGFVNQLKLYQDMGCIIDPDNKKYKLFQKSLKSERSQMI